MDLVAALARAGYDIEDEFEVEERRKESEKLKAVAGRASKWLDRVSDSDSSGEKNSWSNSAERFPTLTHVVILKDTWTGLVNHMHELGMAAVVRLFKINYSLR